MGLINIGTNAEDYEERGSIFQLCSPYQSGWPFLAAKAAQRELLCREREDIDEIKNCGRAFSIQPGN